MFFSKKKTKAEKFAAYKEQVKKKLGGVLDEFFADLEKDYVRRIEIEVEEVAGDALLFHCNLSPNEMRERAKEVKGCLPYSNEIGWEISVDGVESWAQIKKTNNYQKTVINKPERSDRKSGWWRYYASRRGAEPSKPVLQEPSERAPRKRKNYPTYPGVSFVEILEEKKKKAEVLAVEEKKKNNRASEKKKGEV